MLRLIYWMTCATAYKIYQTEPLEIQIMQRKTNRNGRSMGYYLYKGYIFNSRLRDLSLLSLKGQQERDNFHQNSFLQYQHLPKL